jgi:carboxylesterase type B
MADDAEGEAMTDLSIADRLFNKALFHSEQDRQDFIGQKARQFERDLRVSLLKDKDELRTVAADVFAELDDDLKARVIEWVISGDLSGAYASLHILRNETDRQIKNICELRAVRAVDAMTPEDFKPN